MPPDKAALLIIDMVKDNLEHGQTLPIHPHARAITQPINRLCEVFRARGWPIVFATDAYRREDFIFTGRLQPHSLAGTAGAEISDLLVRRETDIRLPKPRFSAFFGTELDRELQRRGVTLCAVAGIATHFCVLATVMDALCHDFKAVLLENCCAAPSAEIHDHIIAVYRRNPLYPLLRVMSWEDFAADMGLTVGATP